MSPQPTTPFGPQPLSLAIVVARASSEAAPKDVIAEKWKIFDNLREAKTALGLSVGALSVLNALLTFHPDTTLQFGSDLIVFASNKSLTFRANGISPSTLRRHLAALVRTGVVIRRDSPNGKRYARKGKGGSIEQAFGFDLSPLLTRAAEFENLAQEARAERKARPLLREQITVLRRDIGKTIAFAIEEHLPGPWDVLLARFKVLNETPPKAAGTAELEAIATDMRALWADVDNLLKYQLKMHNLSANEPHIERHYQKSKPDPLLDFEQSHQKELAEASVPQPEAKKPPIRTFSLETVLQACPDIAMYARREQRISTWRDLIDAADVVRGALVISPSAWKDACAVIGDEDAAIVVAAMLQRSNKIVSAGGYLRKLTEQARRGKFSVGPMVMALLRVALADRSNQHDAHTALPSER
jgi:replication initiation protein RepC